MNAQLNIDLGSLVPDDYEGRVQLSEDWVDYAQSQIDGELLDLLHEQWLRAKTHNQERPQETSSHGACQAVVDIRTKAVPEVAY